MATLGKVSSNLSALPPLGVVSGETLFVDRGVILLQHTRSRSSVSSTRELSLVMSHWGTPPLPLVRHANINQQR